MQRHQQTGSTESFHTARSPPSSPQPGSHTVPSPPSSPRPSSSEAELSAHHLPGGIVILVCDHCNSTRLSPPSSPSSQSSHIGPGRRTTIMSSSPGPNHPHLIIEDGILIVDYTACSGFSSPTTSETSCRSMPRPGSGYPEMPMAYYDRRQHATPCRIYIDLWAWIVMVIIANILIMLPICFEDMMPMILELTLTGAAIICFASYMRFTGLSVFL